MAYTGYKNRKRKVNWLINKYNKLDQRTKTLEYTLSDKEIKSLKKNMIITIADKELISFSNEAPIMFPFWERSWFHSIEYETEVRSPLKFTLEININLGLFPSQLLPYIKILHYYSAPDNIETVNPYELGTRYIDMYFCKDEDDNYYIKGFLSLSKGEYDTYNNEWYCTLKLFLINPYNFTGTYKYGK